MNRLFSKLALFAKITNFCANLAQNFESMLWHIVDKLFNKGAKGRNFSRQSEFRKKFNQLLWRLMSMIGCTLVLTGCIPRCVQRASPYSLKQTDLEDNIGRALGTEAVESAVFPEEPWWAFFNDPQLSHFIELSLSCHPDIKLAQARANKAYEEAMVVRSILYPHLFLFGDATREKVSEYAPGFVPGFPDLFTLTTLQLTTSLYELDIWNKNHALYYAALDRVQAEIAEYEEAKLILSTLIASAYFNLQIHRARLKINQERLAARSEVYDLLKQQFDLGIISEFWLYRTDTEVEFIKDEIFALKAAVEIDEHALSALVGNVECICSELSSESGRIHTEPAAKFERPFPVPATLPIDLLARRPDITAQKWLVEAAQFDIHVAKANFLPRIDLRALIGFQSLRISDFFTGKTLTALAGAAGTLPIFTAGQLRGELGIACEDLEIAIERYNQLVLRAVQEVSDSLSNLIAADDRKKALVISTSDAKELYQLTKQKYESGVANKIKVLNAIENYLVQSDLEMKVEGVRFQSAVELIRAIGGGYYDGNPCQ